MNSVKHKGTTKKPKFSVCNFEELESQFLMDIIASVTMEENPSDMVLHWDQTTIKYIPLSEWTMAKKESKRVEVLGIDGKCQITAMFAAPLSGNFLPIQLIYEGKTSRCNPAVDFPEGYHWCNLLLLLYLYYSHSNVFLEH